MIVALEFQWDGEHMVPLHPRLADRQYVVGEIYRLDHVEDRSRASHSHFFAALQEAWSNLPEDLSERFPTSDHLRRYALVHCGYRDERSIVCASQAEAGRFAAFVKPMDDFAVVSVNRNVVVVMTAKSQSMKAMGKAEFQRSKDTVLDFVAKLIGVSQRQLEDAI